MGAAIRAFARRPIRSVAAGPSSARASPAAPPFLASVSPRPYLLQSSHDSESRRPMTRAWVEIDLGALCRNGAAVAARAGVPLLPMVKADGYGLGGLRAALALESLEPWGYGVATVAEGDELRRGGITRPVIVFTPILRTEIDALRRAAPEGVFTHFHSAELDDGSRDVQEQRFDAALAALPTRPALIHAEN